MELKELAKKPELVQIVLDNPDLVEAYGEAITFYMKDFVDINVYFDFFQAQGERDGKKLGDVIKTLILDSKGQQAIPLDQELPVDIVIAVLAKINENLGKSKARLSTPVGGAQ